VANIAQEPILLQEVEQNYFDVLKLLVFSARHLVVTNQAMVGITKSFVEGHAAEFLLLDEADESYPCALSKDGKKIWWSAEAEIYCLRKHIDDCRVDEVCGLLLFA